MTTHQQRFRLIKALLGQPVDKTPVWLMRQAGRYLPEYRALRETVPDFMQFCRTPELAAQATLQPLQRFDLDAAIVFSDILVVPAAMGMSVEFIKGEGPHFPQPLRSQKQVDKLNKVAILDRLEFVFDTIRLVKKDLCERVPLIGFAGSPWTCAAYMVEGGASKNFSTIKTLCYTHSSVIHSLLESLTEVTIAYLNAQINAGAQVVMVFDTWGGLLSTPDYEIFSLNYLRRIAAGLIRLANDQPVPLIFFTKGGGQWLQKIAMSGCDALGLDWTTDMGLARQQVNGRVALQGNLDPCVLLSNPAKIQHSVQMILQSYGQNPGHIFNLGHGVLPETPPEHVQVLVDAVHNG